MIKPIDEIPQSKAEKRKSYREMIRNDIREAIDKGIPRFEFVGDYNFKGLAQPAREEARNLMYRMARERFNNIRGDEEIYLSSLDFNTEKYIRISRIRGEAPDRPHVYCQIDLSGLDGELERLFREKKERAERYQEERKRRKLAFVADDELKEIRVE